MIGQNRVTDEYTVGGVPYRWGVSLPSKYRYAIFSASRRHTNRLIREAMTGVRGW
jgi:hypothetical protein